MNSEPTPLREESADLQGPVQCILALFLLLPREHAPTFSLLHMEDQGVIVDPGSPDSPMIPDTCPWQKELTRTSKSNWVGSSLQSTVLRPSLKSPNGGGLTFIVRFGWAEEQDKALSPSGLSLGCLSKTILPGFLLTASLSPFSDLQGPSEFCLEASQAVTSYPWAWRLMAAPALNQAVLVSFQSRQCIQPSPLSGLQIL